MNIHRKFENPFVRFDWQIKFWSKIWLVLPNLNQNFIGRSKPGANRATPLEEDVDAFCHCNTHGFQNEKHV